MGWVELDARGVIPRSSLLGGIVGCRLMGITEYVDVGMDFEGEESKHI